MTDDTLNENRDISKEFYFQWHITNKCNLRCKHCYQSSYEDISELSLEELKSIADEIDSALTIWKRKGRVAVTGGEPFVRKDFMEIMSYLDKKQSISLISILTNGILVNKHIEELKMLKKLHFIQISLEGGKEKNDNVRGKNTFDKIISCTKLLYENKISVRWMVTLHKNNVEDVPLIIDLALENNVDVLIFERVVPTGQGKSMESIMLSPEELSNTYDYICKRSDNIYESGGTLKIFKYRTIWILTDPKRAENDIKIPFQNEVGASCSIGMDSLCILPDATVLPCRRLPIPIGNLKTDTIFKIWYTSEILWKIRDKRNLKGKCNSCEFVPRCGGCRAIAYALTGDYLAEDSQCKK